MNIIDKIVSQTGLPSMTNVVWHNPESNELKIQNKNGWETVGGSPGGSNVTPTSNGYPIVDVGPNVMVEGELYISCSLSTDPNTYYRISQMVDSMLTLLVNPFEWTNTSGKYLMFSFDDLENLTLNSVNQISSYSGVLLTENTDINTKQTYPYKLILPYANIYGMEILILNDLTDATTTMAYVPALSDLPFPLMNIQVKQTDEYYLIEGIPAIVKEVANDSIEYEHKYEIVSFIGNLLEPDTVFLLYTYQENDQIIGSMSLYGSTVTFPIRKFNVELVVDTVNEYVFEMITPVSLVAPASLKWNNNVIPDLDIPGIYTLSIVGGIGCYSFVPF